MNSLFKELCQPLTASLSVGSCPVQFTWFTGWRLARLGFQLAAGNWQLAGKRYPYTEALLHAAS